MTSPVRISILSLLVSLSLFSCTQDVYKAFYRGDGETMYFIYPLHYDGSEQLKSDLKVDYTFMDQHDSVRVMISILTKKQMKVESIAISSDHQKYAFNSLERVLFKKNQNKFELRYAASSSVDIFKYLLKENEASVVINDSLKYEPTGKTMKALQYFESTVIEPLDY